MCTCVYVMYMCVYGVCTHMYVYVCIRMYVCGVLCVCVAVSVYIFQLHLDLAFYFLHSPIEKISCSSILDKISLTESPRRIPSDLVCSPGTACTSVL